MLYLANYNGQGTDSSESSDHNRALCQSVESTRGSNSPIQHLLSLSILHTRFSFLRYWQLLSPQSSWYRIVSFDEAEEIDVWWPQTLSLAKGLVN